METWAWLRILRTRLGRVLGSAEGPLEVTQGSTPGPKVSIPERYTECLRYLRKGRYSVIEPWSGERQTQKPGKQSVSSKITWEEFMRKGRRGMVQSEKLLIKGSTPPMA